MLFTAGLVILWIGKNYTHERKGDTPLMGKFNWKSVTNIGLVVGSVAVIGFTGLQVTSTIEKTDALKVELAQRKDELKKLRSEDVITAEAVKEAQASTNLKGAEVATLQNEYSSGTNLKKIAEKLDVYFGENDKNARVPWLTNSAENKDTWTWTFETKFAYDRGESDVAWVARNKTGQVMAYTLAKYDTTNGVFKDVKRHVTIHGAKATGTSKNQLIDNYTKEGTTTTNENR